MAVLKRREEVRSFSLDRFIIFSNGFEVSSLQANSFLLFEITLSPDKPSITAAAKGVCSPNGMEQLWGKLAGVLMAKRE
ncbi:MAG: hypothetical protein AAF922_17675 [Pseudomonadota bacterium]